MLFHGYKNSEMNYDLYEKQVAELSKLVKLRINNEIKKFKQQVAFDEGKVKLLKDNLNHDLFICPSTSAQFASGTIINCPTIKDTNKSYIYRQIIDSFECDFVFVIDNERLHSDLVEHYIGSGSSSGDINYQSKEKKKKVIELLHKSGGVIPVESRENSENIRMSNYFNGPFNNFNFHEHEISLNAFKLLKFYPSNLNESILPIGETTELKNILKEVDVRTENVVNKIVSIPHLDTKILDDLKIDFKDKINKKYREDFAKAPVAYLARMYLIIKISI